MSRTCDPASVANRIAQVIAQIGPNRGDLHAYGECARREFQRYTIGLRDYERQQVLFLTNAQLRGRVL